MTETRADDLVGVSSSRRKVRWQAAVELLGLAGLVVAVATTVDDVQGKVLPGPGPLAAGLLFSGLALVSSGAGWAALFSRDADRRALVTALYTSQLIKYLPAGGLVQVASQVTLTGQSSGMTAAAVRLPVFSACTVCAGATLGSLLAFNEACLVGRACSPGSPCSRRCCSIGACSAGSWPRLGVSSIACRTAPGCQRSARW